MESQSTPTGKLLDLKAYIEHAQAEGHDDIPPDITLWWMKWHSDFHPHTPKEWERLSQTLLSAKEKGYEVFHIPVAFNNEVGFQVGYVVWGWDRVHSYYSPMNVKHTSSNWTGEIVDCQATLMPLSNLVKINSSS